MIKKVIGTLAILFFLLSNQTFAHTALESSTPKDGEVVQEPLQQITLNFGTKVENTSTIEVFNSKGESIKLGNFEIDGSEMFASFLQPLTNDNYKVLWKIVGADGHPINGEFSFAVDAPLIETPTEDNKTEKTSEANDSQQTKKESATVVENSGELQQEEQNLPTYLIPSIVVVLFIVGIGFLWWLLRRK